MGIQIEVVTDPLVLIEYADLAETIDAMGKKSAISQQLSQAITSVKLFALHGVSQQQKLWIARNDDDNDVVGYLKTGIKHLFYVTPKGEYKELDPLCVLDFYVEESYQRSGIGVQLFQHMLRSEQTKPHQLAYDRPSSKLFAFLKKHAGIEHYFPQPNNFVIFDEYFHQPR